MSVESLYNTRATVMQFTPASGGWGTADGYSETSALPCRIRALSGSPFIDGKARKEATHRVYLPFGSQVTERDRLRIGGIDYVIIGPVMDAGGGAGHHLEIDVKVFS